MAQSDGLVVFCQNSRLIDRYREEIARAPERASNYYRMARAAEAIGRDDTALESYREAIQKARPDETIDGISLAGAARDHLFRLLMRQAGRPRRERELGRGRSRSSRAAARYARTDGDRLEAPLAARRHPPGCRRIRVRPSTSSRASCSTRGCGRSPVAADDGRRTIRADLMVADRLAAIVRRYGREPYARLRP